MTAPEFRGHNTGLTINKFVLYTYSFNDKAFCHITVSATETAVHGCVRQVWSGVKPVNVSTLQHKVTWA